MQRLYENIVLSSPGEGGESSKSLLWSLPVYDKKGPSQVTLLGPSQVPRSSRGALGLESTLPRESSSGPWLISTLDPHLSPSRKMPPK